MRKRGVYRIVGKWPAAGLLLLGATALVLLTAVAGRAVRAAATSPRRPIYSVETQEKVVALGINCAWDNADIPQLLEILGHYNTRASFFVLGEWCDNYPDSVRAIHQAGHEVGSHSDTHADMTRLDQAAILRQIQGSRAKIEAVTGAPITAFRPPSGAYNDQVIRLIEEAGLYPIQWDCDSLDYRDLTPGQMQERILEKLRPGSILLFHSGAKNTPQALPQIIEAIQARGYTFVPVSELVHPRPYTVDWEGRQHPATP